MKTASKGSFVVNSNNNMPYSYMNNPQIMKVMNDCYGNLNKKFIGGQIPPPVDMAVPSGSCHFMLSGNKFVPVPMQMLLKEPELEQKINMGLTRNETNEIVSRDTSQWRSPNFKNNKDASMLMPFPVPLRNRNENIVNLNNTQFPSKNMDSQDFSKISQQSAINSNENRTYQVKNIHCTGTIERILRWNRSLDDVLGIYEIIAPIISLQEGRVKNQKIMLLRDNKGPILQVHYYSSTHIDIHDFCIGQYLRCIGRMIGFNILSADSIREAKESEISSLSRLSYVCDYSITHNLKKS